MSSLRFLLLVALVLAGLAWAAAALAQAPVDWYTDTGSGGTLAQPARQAKNGGAVAPQTATGRVDVPESDISATPPISSPAHAEPVLGTPADKPTPAVDQRPAARAAQAAPTVTGGEDQDSSASGPIAALPLTGLQLAGLAGAGLCLLVAGAVLRPRRHAAERG